MDFVKHLREMVSASDKLRSDPSRKIREQGDSLLQAAKNLVPLYAQIMAGGNAASFDAARSVLNSIVHRG